jgi:hypothetical protein
MMCLFFSSGAEGVNQAVFLEPVQQAHADTFAAGIHAMIAIDQDTMTLEALKTFDLAQTLQTMDHGKKALKAYTS